MFGVVVMGLVQLAGLVSGLTIHCRHTYLANDELGEFVTLLLITLGFQALLIGMVPYAIQRSLSTHPENLKESLNWMHPHLQLPSWCMRLSRNRTPTRCVVRSLGFVPSAVGVGVEIMIRSECSIPFWPPFGQSRYGTQGLIAVIYLCARMIIVLLFLYFGSGVFGTVIGLTLARSSVCYAAFQVGPDGP